MTATDQRVRPQDVKLRRTSPSGRPNPYRTRWATVNGQVFVVDSDRLDGIWRVADETEERFADDPQAWIEFVKSDDYRCAWVLTLARAREQIAAWINATTEETP